MSRGPLPQPNRRRRNAPTISGTSLPAEGRKGRAPRQPAGYVFDTAGRAWWKWAWQTPQSTAWDAGALYAAARRAQLEDDLAAIDVVDTLDLAELLGLDDQTKAVSILGALVGRLKALAGGRVVVMREMRELDKRLGLDPKALAELRWSIVDQPEEPAEPAPAPPASEGRKLRAV